MNSSEEFLLHTTKENWENCIQLTQLAFTNHLLVQGLKFSPKRNWGKDEAVNMGMGIQRPKNKHRSVSCHMPSCCHRTEITFLQLTHEPTATQKSLTECWMNEYLDYYYLKTVFSVFTCTARAERFLRFVQSWSNKGGSHCSFLTLSGSYRIIVFSIIVCIKKLLEPLNKFKIVLKLSFH